MKNSFSSSDWSFPEFLKFRPAERAFPPGQDLADKNLYTVTLPIARFQLDQFVYVGFTGK